MLKILHIWDFFLHLCSRKKRRKPGPETALKTIKNMKVHDYTKAAIAEQIIYAAYIKCSDAELKKEIWKGLDLLQQYLNDDNIVEVDE